MNSPKQLQILALLMSYSLSQANSNGNIDSGGGKSSMGAFANHGSIGSIYKTSNNLSTPSRSSIEQFYLAFYVDADRNGISDYWELNHWGYTGVAPGADHDSDGTTNLHEYLAGTDPTDPTVRLQPELIREGASYKIPIQTSAGRHYLLQISSNLSEWYDYTSFDGTGALIDVVFDTATFLTNSPHAEKIDVSGVFFCVTISKK